jgi:hypothetical protein
MSVTKVSLKMVWIDHVEGSHDTLPATAFRRFDQFNAALAMLATKAPPGGAYDKVSFTVEWADGRQLQTRFDLQRRHAAGGPLAEEHIRRRLEFHCGRWRPDHWTTLQYVEALKLLGEEAQEKAALLLDGYQLGDEDVDDYARMSESRFADLVADAICGFLTGAGDAPRTRIRSFADAGRSPGEAGLIVQLGPAQFEVLVVRSR